jgi:hypothetical protein
LHERYERQVCEADRIAKQAALLNMPESEPMPAQKYAARMKSPDELGSEAEARIVAETMGGELPFGPSGLLLFAADFIFLARVKAQREANKLKVYRA